MMGKLFARLRGEPTPAAVAPDLLAEGNAALGRGDWADAARCYRGAAAAQPGDPLPRLNLGYVLLESGEAQQALDALQQAIALRRPEHTFLHEALYLRGRAQQALDRGDDAIASFRAALDAQPAFEEPLQEMVPLLIAAGRAEEALAHALAARDAMPSTTPGMLAARALHALQRRQEALAVLQGVLAREPAHPGALEASGNLLLELDRPAESLPLFQRLLAAHGPQPATLANLSEALMQLERPAEVLPLTRDAAAQHPEHAALQLNRSLAQLLAGDWLAGWEGFEWRWHAWTGKAAPWEQWPRWRGEDLTGRSIMLVCEQGLGDSIQYLRYVPLVAARAREVVLVLQPTLVPLAQGLAPNCRVVPLGAPVPRADCQCPLMGLPRVFRTTPQTVPASVPYVAVDPQRVAHWRALLPADGRPRVGLNWSGGPKPPHRSVPLELLAGLAGLPCRFVSLQTEVREGDRAALAAWPGLFDAGPRLKDFGDTAAVMECLDLVITVDTSVAHLAGALGRPAWVFLRFAADWRWMIGRTDSPWYPTMRLVRQSVLGDWGPAVAQVQRDLQSFAAPRQ